MTEQKHWYKFSRAFLWTIGAIAFLIFATYGWGFQTMTSWEFRRLAKKAPILSEVPQIRAIHEINDSPGLTLVHDGLAFEVPWSDLDVTKSSSGPTIAVFAFRSGRAVTFFGPSPIKEGLMTEVQKTVGLPVGTVFGQDATKSEYAFMGAMLQETPDKLVPWMDRRNAYRISTLLMIKGIASVGGETGVFRRETNEWVGYQFDDPFRLPRRVTLELFDREDNHVEIIFGPDNRQGASISQGDIDRSLSTLKRSNAPATLPVTAKKNG